MDRAARFDERLAGASQAEQGRARFELAITSVLLDAGAGDTWRFEEPGGGTYVRSEGLAVASFHMFLAGAFSSDPERPLVADARGLEAVTAEAIGKAFQVSAANPLVGLERGAQLLARLGRAVADRPAIFGSEARLGGMFDHLVAQASDGKLPARAVLAAVLEGLGPIWPPRVVVAGVALGDVGRHRLVEGPGETNGLVPFHKLSQWLSYSLFEPLEAAGIRIEGIDELTGLPEYRNGGLFLDLGVVEPRDPGFLDRVWKPEEEPIVEWRALTVCLLDRIADLVRKELGVSAEAMPLAKVLEGGTWAAGRAVAREKRPGGVPPFRIDSDGTVF